MEFVFDDVEASNPIYDMIDQCLQGLVRQRTFNFQDVADDILNDFGVTLTADQVRKRFARLEIGSPTTAKEAEESSSESDDSGASSPPLVAKAAPPAVPFDHCVAAPLHEDEKTEEKVSEAHGSGDASSGASTSCVDEGERMTLSMPSATWMESMMAELSAELPPRPVDGPKSEMQQVLDMLDAHEEETKPATMKELFGISEEEFNRQVADVEIQHKQQMENEVVDAVERRREEQDRENARKDELSTRASMQRALERTTKVFDRVAKALGIEEEMAAAQQQQEPIE